MLIEQLLANYGYIRQSPNLLSLDLELLHLLENIAAKEGLTVEETAHVLLSFAIGEHYFADENLDLWESLTDREKEAAALTCLGYTNDEIAQKMVISTNTVKSHLRGVLTKFKVNSKAELQVQLATWDFSGWDPDMGKRLASSPHLTTSPNGASA